MRRSAWSARCAIATLPMGYADGYRRALGNHAHALVTGRRAPVVGVVTMDMTMLDVPDIDAKIGDVVTLLGARGAEQIDVAELAELREREPVRDSHRAQCAAAARLRRR